MSETHPHHEQGEAGGPRKWVFWVFMLIAGFFLVVEHRAHVVQYLPYLLLLACPLLHLLHGHGSHRRDAGGERNGGKRKEEDRK